MNIAGLSHAEYIFLAYAVTFGVLVAVALYSVLEYRAARRAAAAAGLDDACQGGAP